MDLAGCWLRCFRNGDVSVDEIVFDQSFEQAHSFLSERLVFEGEEDASYEPFDEWASKRRIFHGDSGANVGGFEFKDRDESTGPSCGVLGHDSGKRLPFENGVG